MVFAVSVAHADWLDSLKGMLGGEDKEPVATPKEQASVASALTNDEMVSGVLDALKVGVQRAVEILGKEGGYLNDPQVKIPMPENLRTVEKALRKLKQDKYADKFIASMNHGAEQAVHKATPIFIEAINNMSVEDAKNILQGPDDAATQYFRKTTYTPLTEAIMPVVSKATDESGVTSAYKKLVDRAAFFGEYVDLEKYDLDKYVTEKSLDGLYLKLAEEERAIRKDPVKRSTDILKKVFAAFGK
jgi:hypothetical protein